MDEFDKGYFLAKAEAALDNRKQTGSSGSDDH